MAGLPLYAQRILMQYFPYFNSSYWTLVLPRIVMFLSSLSIDGTVYYLARIFSLDRGLSVGLAASSYVVVVYATRTLTNSAEIFFFCALLVLCFKLRDAQNLNVFFMNLTSLSRAIRKEKLKSKSMSGKSAGSKYGKSKRFGSRLLKRGVKGKEDPKLERRPIHLEDELQDNVTDADDLVDKPDYKISCTEVLCITLLGVVCVVGFYTRPTFIAFAFFPLIYGIVNFDKLPDMKQIFLWIICFLSLGVTTIIMTIIDTLYFHYDDYKECVKNTNSSVYCIYLSVYFSFMVSISPYNFIAYNSNSENLSAHGIHPHYLHFLVNLPLLFGPAFIFLVLSLYNLINYIYKYGFSDIFDSGKSSLNSVSTVIVTLFVFTPVLGLSLFPHQEPRFLVPIVPLVVLISVKHLSPLPSLRKNTYLTVWVIFNAALSLFYGVFHQGGVIPSLFFIQRGITHGKDLESANQHTNFSVNDKFVYFHTYMPPKHLLLSEQGHDQLIDLKGMKFDKLQAEMFSLSQKQKDTLDDTRSIYLLFPGSVRKHVKLQYETVKLFPNHLSTEDFPNVSKVFSAFRSGEYETALHILQQEVSLHMVKVDRESLLQ